MVVAASNNDLFCVTVDHHIAVVRYTYDLPLLSSLPKSLHQFIHNEFVVEMIVVRINHNRRLSLCEVNLKENGRFLSDRQLRKFYLLVLHGRRDVEIVCEN